ncbi:helix-turn-helix domain-containing protein [Chryseobacterium gallinarum]|uniref:Helix-turn-helix domain-containing protein n=1 Tax=Chryseobacterium gallinarum TaxID=1324352 RepID=A0ABX6KX25_CHRGL|nr:helix-turn-helix domain-containing protein [Chryseobacterium gallinarum]QIY92214.1 helix-turn-helix domain-containing protein [Chryseobacterium gallinarum]
MKTKVNRTPTELLDDLRIYCFRLREKGLSLHRIAMKIGRDHTTVIYHLRMYNDLSRFDKGFKYKIKEFEENEFIKKYEAFKKRFCCNVVC